MTWLIIYNARCDTYRIGSVHGGYMYKKHNVMQF